MKIGVDIVDLERIDVHNAHFIKRILSKNELIVFESIKNEQRQREYLGGRFAGKEAYLKANQKGLGGLPFTSIEILNREDGSPYLNDENAEISISHENKYAVAFVILKK